MTVKLSFAWQHRPLIGGHPICAHPAGICTAARGRRRWRGRNRIPRFSQRAQGGGNSAVCRRNGGVSAAGAQFRGFRISYNAEQVLPTMTCSSVRSPRASTCCCAKFSNPSTACRSHGLRRMESEAEEKEGCEEVDRDPRGIPGRLIIPNHFRPAMPGQVFNLLRPCRLVVIE